jgi:hypothetical protein
MPLTKSELKAWTDALRANPEQQITGKLVNKLTLETCEIGFCCLGKLCETLGGRPAPMYKGLGFDGETTYLPAQIAEKLAVVTLTRDGSFSHLGMPELCGWCSLAHANDNGATWPEIADHLDKYYPAVEEAPDET